jgi:proline iminopeptidase
MPAFMRRPAFVRLPLAAAIALVFLCAPRPSRAQGPSSSPLATGEHDVVVNGVRLWYRVAGNGSPKTPPVLFLHGGPGYNSYSFARIEGPFLEKQLRMIYLDQRGSGRSERPWTRDYKMATLVEDIDALRRSLGVNQIAVIGHSFGGTLALEYASAHPANVSKLILVDILYDAPAQCRYRAQGLAQLRPEAYARVAKDTVDSAGVRRSDCELEFRALGGADREAFSNEMMFPDSTRRKLQDSLDRASGLRNTGELSNALFDAGLLSYRFTAFDRLTMPVLVIMGGQDRAVGGPPMRELAKRVPHGQLLELPKGGHFVYLEEPEAFARAVTRFLLQ